MTRRACSCCGPALGRRSLLAASGLLVGSALLSRARAEDGTKYEAMLLTCIDPRFVTPVFKWMDGRGLDGKYSRFGIAGAGVGAVAPAFKAWHPAFWDNLGASIQLHQIERVIVVNHRDCGAAAIAYGNQSIATREAETALHQKVFAEFKAQLAVRQPLMRLEGALMALDGSMEALG